MKETKFLGLTIVAVLRLILALASTLVAARLGTGHIRQRGYLSYRRIEHELAVLI